MKTKSLLNIHPLSLSLLLSFFSATAVLAQTDSIRTEYSTEYSEENIDSSDFKIKQFYRYITRARVEETSMFKLSFLPAQGWSLTEGFRGGFANSIAYERKFIPAFSGLIELRNAYHFDNFSHFNTKLFDAKLNLALRWYLTINKRMREGRSANNFSNNYLSIQSNNFLYSVHKAEANRVPIYKHESSFPFAKSISLLYGTQKRLGKRSFIDFNLGPEFIPNKTNKYAHYRRSFGYAGSFTLGLAW